VAERTYLTLEDIFYLHSEQLRLFGGAEGVRDEGLILSALLRPQTGYYSDLVEEAAALWESLAMNHGFVDGNKRVALAATYAFLHVNGLAIEASEDALIEFIYTNLEAGTFLKDVLDGWLRQNSRPTD
jgi:death-on-curing protein